MESAKVVFYILNLFGWTTYVLGITSNWTVIDNWKSFLLFLLGGVFIAVRIMDKYEDWRKKRMDNDEKKWELGQKHKHDKK